MNKLILAWRDPVKLQWCPIGILTFDGQVYRFVYTKRAKREFSGRAPSLPFEDLNTIYVSEELFPIFKNRIMNRNRVDFSKYLEYLKIDPNSSNPLSLLEASGGFKPTDYFELFSIPTNGNLETSEFRFFTHGLRHIPDASLKRILSLQPEEKLLLLKDIQNSYDPDALALRTVGENSNDRFFVGFCPRYLIPEINEALDENVNNVEVRVDSINKPPAPLQFRLRCKVVVKWPKGYVPFSNEDFEPAVQDFL